MEQQIISEKDVELEVQAVDTTLVSINEPITSELISLDSETDVKVIHEQSADLLILTEGGSLYKDAVKNGYSGTELEWMSELLDSKASVQFVVTTFADGNQAYAAALLALRAEVGSTYASNTYLAEVFATRDLARASDKHVMEAKIATDIQASYNSTIEVMVTKDLALSQQITEFSAELGPLNASITSLQQALVTEGQARAIQIDSLSSSLNNRITAEITTTNETLVNSTSALAQQINVLDVSFNDLLTSQIESVNLVIADESSARASQINTLRTDFTSGISAAITSIQEVRIDLDGNTSAIDSITAVVNNPVSGLAAAFSRANEAYTLANGTAGALSVIEGKVNNPTTGLAATYAFVQQVEINAATNTTTAINALRNEITNPSASWIASNTFIQSIKTTADGNTAAITSLSNQLTTLSNGLNGTIDSRIASNSLIQDIRSDLDGNITATSSLGNQVTTLTNNLNGTIDTRIAVNSLVQSIKTTADGNTQAISNLGNQLTTLTNNLNGTIDTRIASNSLIQTIQADLAGNITATSNLGNQVTTLTNNLDGTIDARVASNSLIQSIITTNDNQQTALTNLSSAVSTVTTDVDGLQTWKTSTATVQLTSLTDEVGQLQSRAFLGVSNISSGKATIAGITVDSTNYGIKLAGDVFELVSVYGARQLYFHTATGLWRFTGGIITNDDGVSTRGEYTDDGTYLIWIGTGAKTEANGTFWVKRNGDGYIKGTFFQGQLMRRRYASANVSSVTATGHITAGQPVRIDCTGSYRYSFTSELEVESDPGLMDWVVKRNGTIIASGSRQMTRLKRDPGGEPGVLWRNIDYVSMNIMVFDNNPGTFGTNNSYTFEMADLGYGVFSTTVATDENLIG